MRANKHMQANAYSPFFEVFLPVELVYNQRYLAGPASPDVQR
jgi:hypothetical protein